MDELNELVLTLKGDVVATELIRLREIHVATFFGEGTVAAWAELIRTSGISSVVVNDPLTPRQQRNLQEALATEVLDRTDVILDIFAARALSADGRIQVEKARLEHLLPRLAGGWTHLERQRGGLGLRGGAGETQIEVDRRLIRARIAKLSSRLKILERRRSTQRLARTTAPLATVALVGYTNAGKSTLLNRLTRSDVLADDLLFATLDPTSRLLYLASGQKLILTDTVGFIQRLPTELVDAFSSTLEEVRSATMLAIVVDLSHPQCAHHLETVLGTLDEMHCEQPAILVCSKVDKVDSALREERIAVLSEQISGTPLCISSTSGEGFETLRDALQRLFDAAEVKSG